MMEAQRISLFLFVFSIFSFQVFGWTERQTQQTMVRLASSSNVYNNVFPFDTIVGIEVDNWTNIEGANCLDSNVSNKTAETLNITNNFAF